MSREVQGPRAGPAGSSWPQAARDLLLRMLPHQVPTGLRVVGRPGPASPVLVTGNYALTVRRLVHALKGRDAWVLCADSRGINVWCAAGGGHLTHHDIIAAVRVTRLAERVGHRELVLPQLCATGVERRRVEEATGFRARWGPARLDDLPGFLDRGNRVVRAERGVRFPLRERLEMALVWGWPTSALALLVGGWLGGWRLAVSLLVALVASAAGLYAALPWLRLAGRARWPTLGIFALCGFGMGAAVSALLGAGAAARLPWLGLAEAAALGVLALDLEGTTPLYASALGASGRATIELVEGRCSGAAECVQVCPRDVLAMDGRRRKVTIARPDDCVRCGACIVQCPEDALRFRMPDGSVVEGPAVRSTRLNLLGRRAIEVETGDGAPSRGRD